MSKARTSVWRGPTCLLDGERQVVLWVRTNPSATITLDFGRDAVVKEQKPVDGGRRPSVLVPKGVGPGDRASSPASAVAALLTSIETAMEPSTATKKKTKSAAGSTRASIRPRNNSRTSSAVFAKTAKRRLKSDITGIATLLASHAHVTITQMNHRSNMGFLLDSPRAISFSIGPRIDGILSATCSNYTRLKTTRVTSSLSS